MLIRSVCLCCCAVSLFVTDVSGDMLEYAAWSPERVWIGRDGDEGSVHCLGNGRLCVYAQGPDVIQLFGPPYSVTTIGRMDLIDEGLAVRSRRVKGAAIWRHYVSQEGNEITIITDFVDSELPCFIRRIDTTAPLTYRMSYEPDVDVSNDDREIGKAGADGGLLVRTPIGKPSVPFGNYPIPFAFFHQFAWKGNASVVHNEGENTATFTFSPGTSTLYAAGGPGLAECVGHAETALATDYDTMLERTRAYWRDFTAKGRDFQRELPKDVPMRGRLVQVLDDCAVMIKAQQAVEGGVMAGYPYHLGYVRDQYGTYRGIWALGHEEMARNILDFYYRVFERGGWIRNAQAFGIDGLFHIHENDDVETTGYIMLQAFHYADNSGDADFLRRIFPMLEWAWDVQTKHLVRNMLPFNGDETYVAGGVLPRSTLNDGSAESTLLFIDSGERFLDYVEQEGHWNAQLLEKARETLRQVRQDFRDNFWHNGQLITNNPARREVEIALPRTRHGVCEACVRVRWTMRTENDRYVCVPCWDEDPLTRAEPTIYRLQSVSLTPLYFGSPMFEKSELTPIVDGIFEQYRKTGKLPSRPDSEVTVGYDYGLVLWAMTEIGHPAAEVLHKRTLELADPTGAWSEYYVNHQPRGTRCRPWESAINIEAILHWIENGWTGR